jgi:8-oxo-dGTP pyrophosphatase MutT (NUDIX family)
MSRYAGGFIYNPITKKVLLQQRTLDAPINPGLWTIFGGGEESEDNGGIEATFIREMQEETGILLEKKELNLLRSYWVDVNSHKVERFVFWVVRDMDEDSVVLGEGMAFGWFTLPGSSELGIGPHTLEDMALLEARLL